VPPPSALAFGSTYWQRIGKIPDVGYYTEMARDPIQTGETRINVVDALRGQQEQLKRLIAQKIWISEAPKPTLAEIESQLGELRRLIGQLESDIRAQMKNAS
jgi:hypothetical protein